MSRRRPPGPIADLRAWADAAAARIGDRQLVLSVSGGKDSTATGLLLKEARIPFRAVHCDTGWEHEDTEAYLRDYLPGVLGVPIEVIGSHHGGMEQLCRTKGMFPSRLRRFCTQELKVRPFIRYVRGLQAAGVDPVNALGIRAGESAARAQLPEWEWKDDFDCEVWRPVLTWSEAHVIQMHHRHDIAPNPLYLRGATRVGCWPCIFARKAEIRMIADTDPSRIERIRALEEQVRVDAARRYEEQGETFESLGLAPPSWFQNPTSRGRGTTGKHSGKCWPIDDVVAWSRTKRGGHEEELLAPPYAEQGCMRWGLCETDAPDQGQGVLGFVVAEDKRDV